MTEPIALLVGADDAYAMPLAVTVFSALDALPHGCEAVVTVVDDGISEANRRRIYRVLAGTRARTRVEWVRPDAKKLQGLSEMGHLSRAAYLRLLAPEIVAGSRVVYLDTDLIVRRDLTLLWTLDVGDCAIAAVLDGRCPRMRDAFPGPEEQGLDPALPYFNTGVLVMNLDAWRETKAADAIITNLIDNKDRYLYADQDGINAVFSGRVKAIDPRWNVQMVMTEIGYGTVTVDEAFIVHYTMANKPWNRVSFGSRRPYFAEFYRLLRRSAWFSEAAFAAFMTRLYGRALANLPARAALRLRP